MIRDAVAFAVLYLAIEQQHLHPVASVGGFAVVGGDARLLDVLDDGRGRNRSTALWGHL